MTSRAVICQIEGCRKLNQQEWWLKTGEPIGLCLYHAMLLLSMGYESYDDPPAQMTTERPKVVNIR